MSCGVSGGCWQPASSKAIAMPRTVFTLGKRYITPHPCATAQPEGVVTARNATQGGPEGGRDLVLELGTSRVASSAYPRLMESKKSALFLVARILSKRNSVASNSSIG